MAEREKPLTRMALAALFGVEPRTIHNWTEAGCPVRRISGRPMYVLSEVIPWRREKDKAEARGDEELDEKLERTLKIKAERELAETKLAEQRRVLVPGAEVERTWERTLGILDARMTSARGKWAPKIVGLMTMPEATAAMDALIADLRAAFVEGAEELEDVETDTDSEEAA